ncbi:PucR family transcriptional regulator [Microtetraspora sp. NBRC 13810]|uniref:PucR family transcriptional regulator n=1 Tax=Microtetraspora sp. NBRC 13810 TaxID=3030990 RepID=UPI0024A376E8|nr:PucR family transcriptional regulator [Microtetraspora sp. NBRC 13810]GLW08408.1 PucR family transcriptional regulator [Microtetraspora sp. NBRC 13810]
MGVTPTLRRVVAIVPLRLRVLTGADALDRPVRWVAVSELEDPTPFLEGGELLLTTGMRLTSENAAAYVRRLVARQVAGLGFGVGLGHEAIPDELVRVAAEAGLPLVEVPREIPFVAVGKAVSDLLAAEQHEELSHAFAAQGRLTRAALRPDGMRAVVRRLAREIGGWAVLLDPGGAVLAAAGDDLDEDSPEIGERVADLLPELDRLKDRPGSVAVSTPGQHVIAQPLGGARRVRGFFAVGLDRAFSPVAHTVVNVACSLLTLALEREAEEPAAERRVRSAVLRLLLAGQREAACHALAALGDRLPEGDVSVLATAADQEAVREEAAGVFAAALDGMTVFVVPAARAGQVAEAVARHGPVGVGGPAPLDGLSAGLDRARRALAAARRAGTPVMSFADLPGQGLLALLDPAAADAFAAALLAPLTEYGSRADLLESLRAYLACNGHWDAAAQRLGVHRHTLRYRMRKVAELLGRDLDDPAARAELWIALSRL